MLASFTAEENVHVSKNLITTVKLYGFIGNEWIALAKDSHSTGSLTLFNIVPTLSLFLLIFSGRIRTRHRALWVRVHNGEISQGIIEWTLPPVICCTYVHFIVSFLFDCICLGCVQVIFIFLKKEHLHRHAGKFLPGGGCSEQFVQKFSPVVQIFTKQSKRNQGHTMH